MRLLALPNGHVRANPGPRWHREQLDRSRGPSRSRLGVVREDPGRECMAMLRRRDLAEVRAGRDPQGELHQVDARVRLHRCRGFRDRVEAEQRPAACSWIEELLHGTNTDPPRRRAGAGGELARHGVFRRAETWRWRLRQRRELAAPQGSFADAQHAHDTVRVARHHRLDEPLPRIAASRRRGRNAELSGKIGHPVQPRQPAKHFGGRSQMGDSSAHASFCELRAPG